MVSLPFRLTWLVPLAVFCLALLLAACGDDDDSGASDDASNGTSVVSRNDLKSQVNKVYGSVEVPAGACSAEVITALIDLDFDRVESDGDWEAFATALLTIASEIRGLKDATAAGGADPLYDDIAAVAEDAYAREAANGEDAAEEVENQMTAWSANTFVSSSFTKEAGCTLST